ncbi:MAG: hypothetical protein WCG27_00685 [Pseudomonadota bacterium]
MIRIISLLLVLGIFMSCSHSLPHSEKVSGLSGDEKEKALDPQEADKRLEELVIRLSKEKGALAQFVADDLFLKATDASLRNEPQVATLLYKYVSLLRPEDEYLQRKYAVELIRNGDLETALNILQSLDEQNKHKDETIGLILGGLYSATGQTQMAQKTYSRVMAVNPKSEDACLFVAKSSVEEKKYDQAEKVINDCQGRIKHRAVFSYLKGKIAMEKHEREKALGYFKESLRFDSKYHQAVMAMALMSEEKERYSEAIGIYKKYLEKDATNFVVLGRLVQIMFMQEKFKEVLPYAEQLSNLDSGDLNLKVRLGILYTDNGRYEDAKGLFREILTAMPDSDKVLYYLGALSQQTSEPDQAMSYYSQITSTSALFHDANIQIAQLLTLEAQSTDKKEVAEQKLLQFVQDRTVQHDILKLDLNLVLVAHYDGKGDYDKAIDLLKSLKNEKGFGQDHDYYLAAMLEKNDRHDEAMDIMIPMLDKNPNNPQALNFVGYSFLEGGKELSKAHEYISKALQLKPEDAYIRDSLGWYYYRIGDLEKALKEVKIAWEKERGDVTINKHLAIIYRDLKKFDLAKKYYKEALSNCKEEAERRDVLKALEGMENHRLPASVKE